MHDVECETDQWYGNLIKHKVLEDIGANKAHGPDNIPGRLLKETAHEIRLSYLPLV